MPHLRSGTMRNAKRVEGGRKEGKERVLRGEVKEGTELEKMDEWKYMKLMLGVQVRKHWNF